MADTTADTVKKTVEQAAATAKVQNEQFKAQAEKFQATAHASPARRHGKDQRLDRRTVGPVEAEP